MAHPELMSEHSVFNLLAELPDDLEAEEFRQLCRCRNLTIERIVSPPGTRSDLMIQEQDEWILVLQGQALLTLDGEKQPLSRGDSLFIPAGSPHRVLDTSSAPLCIWLAVHLYPDDR